MRCAGQQPAILGRACLRKSQPRPHSLWSLHLFVFPSEAAAPSLAPWAVAPWSGDCPYHRLGAYPSSQTHPPCFGVPTSGVAAQG